MLGNPFLIAFTTTLRFGENKADFRNNPKAPEGVKCELIQPESGGSKWLIFIIIGVALFAIIAIYALVTICMNSCKKDKANKDYSAVFAPGSTGSPGSNTNASIQKSFLSSSGQQ